jgi:NAD(P)-dependent dehydrogenase (short-subunit alcohol dehydrogenase family)
MSRRHAILFGSTGGIGLKLLELLLSNDFDITLPVRDTNSARKWFESISIKTKNAITLVHVQLEEEKSIKEFLVNFKEENLSCLIFASGVRGQTTTENINLDFEINYVAPVAISIEMLKKFPRLTVINVTSSAAFRLKLDSPKDLFVKSELQFHGNYAKSKLALVLASKCLAKMYPESRVISVDPGDNRTKMTLGRGSPWLLRFVAKFFFPNPSVGAHRVFKNVLDDNLISGSHITAKDKVMDTKRYEHVTHYVFRQILSGFPYMPR